MTKQGGGMDRREFLQLGAAAGAVAIAASAMPKFLWADVKKTGLDECVGMSVKQMAENSRLVMDSWDYLQMTAATIKNTQLRRQVAEILTNPAPLFAGPLADSRTRRSVWEELQAKKLLTGVSLDDFLPATGDFTRSSQHFYSAPGSGYQSHHSYPGGLVTHTALNVKVSLGISEGYREIYGYELDRDTVIVSQLLHDLHKPWVFQWNDDNSSRTELRLADTGEHHVYSIAESISRGMPAEICVAQACAHNHPGFPKDEAEVVKWIKAASILCGVDPQARGLLEKGGETLPQPRRMENFVCHLGDHDYVLSVPVVQWLLPVMQSVAIEKYGMTQGDLRGKPFNSFRNYVFSQATAMTLYHAFSTGGKDGLTRALARIVSPV